MKIHYKVYMYFDTILHQHISEEVFVLEDCNIHEEQFFHEKKSYKLVANEAHSAMSSWVTRLSEIIVLLPRQSTCKTMINVVKLQKEAFLLERF